MATTTSSTTQLTALLDALGERVSSHDRPDLRAATGLVADIGRIAVSGDEQDVRGTQSALGALRGSLGDCTPAQYLHSVDGQTFLAGALWALSTVLDRRLDSIGEQRAAGQHHTRKEQISQLVSVALIENTAVSPSELLNSKLHDGSNVRRDELSRTFGTFVQNGWANVVSGDQGRKKFFAATPAGRDALAQGSTAEGVYATAP
jgi:hypothetical protein